ncbi:MAG: hypothetical protein NHB32_14035 [Fischerella sp. CENA71]|nr:hypothetical protein [Fischerella sp. CENA71]
MGKSILFKDEQPPSEPTCVCAFEIPSNIYSIFNGLWEDDHHKKLIESVKAENNPSFQKRNTVDYYIKKQKSSVVAVALEALVRDVDSLRPPKPEPLHRSQWYSYSVIHPLHKSIVVDGHHKDISGRVQRTYKQKFIPFGDNITGECPVKDHDYRAAGHRRAIQVELRVALVEEVERIADTYQLTFHDVASQAIERYGTKKNSQPLVIEDVQEKESTPTPDMTIEEQKFFEEITK